MIDKVQAAVDAIARIVATDVGRGAGILARYCEGSLFRAAESLLAEPELSASILTGFFIPLSEPPSPETDGPIGAIQIACAVEALGGRVRLLTDSPCEKALTSILRHQRLDIPIDVSPLPQTSDPQRYLDWEENLLQLYASDDVSISHMVSIERVGPAADGRMYNMRGADITAQTSPLHRIFVAGDRVTIGIGDGGNEIGMGVLPREVVADNLTHGETIHCAIPCDHLIAAGTSNWGAAGLVAALKLLSGRGGDELDRILEPEWSQQALRTLLREKAAVDGVLQRFSPTVDGLDWAEYSDVLGRVATLARSRR